jgi:hypothetical protein
MNKTVIGIVGTRGIPNRYGGFEELAEVLSRGLVEKGFEVHVYNSHDHINQNTTWHGVNIIHKYNPEHLFGLGALIYDFNTIWNCRKNKFDIIIQLGYATSSIWVSTILPKKTKVVTNMDGLEWKRAKYGFFTRNFIKVAERIAVKRSNYLIADSPIIKKYLTRYQKEVETIAYGAKIFEKPDAAELEQFELEPYNYHLLIARMVPENNIEMILEGYLASESKTPFVVIGNQQNRYGRYVARRFNNKNICFLGPLFNKTSLNNLRFYSNLYFHGHTVGGTNPSLLEAMASSAFICAHNNTFNKAVLGENAVFFKTSQDISKILMKYSKDIEHPFILRNRNEIKKNYVWSNVVDRYAKVLLRLSDQRTKTHDKKKVGLSLVLNKSD